MVRPNGSVIALDSAARGLAESPFIPDALSLAAAGAALLQRCPGRNLSIGGVRDNWGIMKISACRCSDRGTASPRPVRQQQAGQRRAPPLSASSAGAACGPVLAE